MPSLMATSLRWRTHSARTNLVTLLLRPSQTLHFVVTPVPSHSANTGCIIVSIYNRAALLVFQAYYLFVMGYLQG